MAFAAYDAQALGHFCRGRYVETASAAYRSNLANPAHSITWVQLAFAALLLTCLLAGVTCDAP
jgi:hypothetical protein